MVQHALREIRPHKVAPASFVKNRPSSPGATAEVYQSRLLLRLGVSEQDLRRGGARAVRPAAQEGQVLVVDRRPVVIDLGQPASCTRSLLSFDL